MCFKKWFHKPDPVIPVTGDKVALIFAIGNYPGSQNDLDGPPYDLRNVSDFFASKYPEFVTKKYLDSEVTKYTFENTIKEQIAVLKSGDTLLIYYSGHGTNGVDSNEPDGYREGLYLYDGTYWDDQFTTILQSIPVGAKVIVSLDSCFAHGSTSPKNSIRRKARFVQSQEVKASAKSTKAMLKSDTMNYIVFAACQENQTSADAFISGEPCGAFTYFWLKAWNKDFTYKQWNDKTASLIKANGEFDQVPNIEGDSNLQQQIVLT